MASVSLQTVVQAARRDPDLAVLEGIHALKHAIRFGASLVRVASPDPDAMRALLADLAPDVVPAVAIEAVDDATWAQVTSGGLPSPSLAVAHRPVDRIDEVLAIDDARPVVLLEHPRHLGNVGAAVRVAAAADAAGLVVIGSADPWHARAIRGGAGLQFALPVARRDALPDRSRPLVAVTPDGEVVAGNDVPRGAILAFGTERGGLSSDLVEQADVRVRLSMRPGVSSLNLATSVAALLFGADLGGPDRN